MDEVFNDISSAADEERKARIERELLEDKKDTINATP